MEENNLIRRDGIDDEYEINLVELFGALLKKWWLILIAALVGALIAFGVSRFLITPKYESAAMLYMVSSSVSITSIADLQIGSELADDFGKIVTSKSVVDKAAKQLSDEKGKEFTRQEILDRTSVSNTATRMLTITVTDTNAEDACDIANAVTQQAADRVAEITKSDPPSIVETAEVSTEPVSPDVGRNTVIGFLIGLLIAAGIITMRFVMNDNIKTEEDIERVLGLKTLVVIPVEKELRTRD